MKNGRLNLILNMIAKFGIGFLIIGAILFLTAGSIQYMNGWLFILALAIPMLVFGIVLLIKDPAALERRLTSKEPDKNQRANISFGGLMFIAAFILSGIDYRFEWSQIPFPVIIAALVVMLFGYGMFVLAIMQNSYASRIVKVYDEQKIITKGLYSVVRHPMYTASLLIFLAMPFILGSWFAVIPMLLYPVILVRRILNEEGLLIDELDGYGDYTKKVRYRLLPFVW